MSTPYIYMYIICSFPSDPYPEGFRASPDFKPEMFTTYHGNEIHPRSSSPPPWFVREGDMVVPNLHVVGEQVRIMWIMLYMCMYMCNE